MLLLVTNWQWASYYISKMIKETNKRPIDNEKEKKLEKWKKNYESQIGKHCTLNDKEVRLLKTLHYSSQWTAFLFIFFQKILRFY